MGAGHTHALFVHEHSRLHHLSPEVKVAFSFAFVLAVAITPRTAVWAFAIYAAILITLVRMASIRARFVLARLSIIVPFVLFAVFIPFIASGEKSQILGVSVSIPGLWASWNVLAKASLGATVSILLAATTEIPEIIRGMGRLRVPPVLTSIASFMVRYLELIAAELGRMRVAMTSRGYDPRWLWQAKPIAASAGALFIRSYERGERVYDAMISRGYTGAMPPLNHPAATAREWVTAAVVPVAAFATSITALVIT